MDRHVGDRTTFGVKRALAIVAAIALGGGCVEKGGHAPAPSPEAAAPAEGDADTRLVALERAENRRDVETIGPEDIGHRDPRVRRAAARALARIAESRSIPALANALADEDPEVVAWGAYGLGWTCRADGVDTNEVVRALVARSVSLPAQGNSPLDPAFALVRAIGRCPTDDGERTLASWLELPEPRAAYAALALGDLASRRKTLAEATQVALLSAAAGSATRKPLAEGLYPFGRFDRPATTVAERLFEVARGRLAEAGPSRIFALRALGRTDASAIGELVRVLTSTGAFDPAERIEAARGLARLGDKGQRALGDALVALAPARDPAALTSLGTDAFGPLVVTLESIEKLPRAARTTLYDLAGLPPPPSAPPSIVRRVVRLRCSAAKVLVSAGADDPLLTKCDPAPDGEIGQRARVEVLGRKAIETPARIALFQKLAASKHVRVREAALELLAAHPEVDARALLVTALGAKEPGVVATAAQVLAAHPDRASWEPKAGAVAAKASSGASAASTNVVDALAQALGRAWAPDDVETVALVADAAAAVHLPQATAKLEAFCADPNPTLREHAARALGTLKGGNTACAAPKPGADLAPELAHLVTQPTKLTFDTDAGALSITLDPTLAPVAVTRFVDLARAGFYDGVALHRVVPGFVVQFGDPGGDGFGSAGKAPLRCETSPAPFDALRVGVALAGRDTGSSQLFVTLARHPHLDGEYAIVGKAEGDWGAAAEGDVVRKVTVGR